jgi:sugar phosphate isomerase/epimerase
LPLFGLREELVGFLGACKRFFAASPIKTVVLAVECCPACVVEKELKPNRFLHDDFGVNPHKTGWAAHGDEVMRIRYVVSTMVFWGRQNRLSLEQECELLRSLGFGAELWPNTGGLDECSYDRKNWPRLAAATEGMLVSMRSRNDKPSVEQWTEQIECAKLLKANIIADLQSLGVGQSREVEDWDYLGEVVRTAEENGIKLCVETGPLDVLKQIGDRFDSVWYCFDTGFVSVDREHGFREYVDALADRTTHLHLSENYGRYDNHRPLGCQCGIARQDWDYLLEALNKYDNDIIGSLEMTPCIPLEMIRRASSFLFDVLKWPNRPQKSAGDSHLH